MSFSELGLHESILRGVADAGYESPTDIQKQAIPLAREGHDLIGLGQTGSGKTAAFGLPMLDRLVGGEPGLRALVLVPTRELCVQVAENLRVYAAHSGLHVRTAFGGIAFSIQEAAIKRGVDVLVACPGRLIDHMQCGTISLENIEMLVLDEADRMLDMGFMPQIGRIVSRLPRERQNWLFSATMPPEIDRLVKDHFGETRRVQVGSRSQAAETILHRIDHVPADDKIRLLTRELKSRDGTVLVFVKTKVRAEELGRKLKRAGLPADSIHGDKGAEARHVVLQAFSRGKVRFMVATDVAARGIDVSSIGLVVNFDFPRALEDYIHRVGRTGRAGTEGEAISYVTRMEKATASQVIEHLRKAVKPKARLVLDGKPDPGALDRPSERKRRRADEDDDRRDDRRETRGRRDDRDDRRSRRPERERAKEPRRAEKRASKAEVELSVKSKKQRDADVHDVVW